MFSKLDSHAFDNDFSPHCFINITKLYIVNTFYLHLKSEENISTVINVDINMYPKNVFKYIQTCTNSELCLIFLVPTSICLCVSRCRHTEMIIRDCTKCIGKSMQSKFYKGKLIMEYWIRIKSFLIDQAEA